jgi:hypothetical protein
VGSWFAREIVATGKLRLFCFFVFFIVTFVFIRISVRMIRAQVKWWPGNVQPGGTHIHHVIYITPLALIGAIRLARPGSPWARRRYRPGSRRLRRAEWRERRIREPVERWKVRFQNFVAGRPSIKP